MKNKSFALLVLASFAAFSLHTATILAQGTAFNYEGQLGAGGGPANGSYDLMFTLYATNSGGAALAGPVTNRATGVTNGMFTTAIDFGPDVFTGQSCWLEIGVETNGGAGFTTLSPRQPLLPVPYAMFAASAATLSGTLPASQISGTVPLTQIPATVITNGETGVNFIGTFSGNGLGLTNVPVNSLAWTTNYGIVAWGDNDYGEGTVPATVTNVLMVASGYAHTLALLRNNTVAAWGENTVGDTVVPAGLSNVQAVAAGAYHSLALTSGGTVVAWGDNTNGQATVPAGLSNVVAIAAGGYHSLALKSNGTVAAWGYDYQGQTNVPAGLTNVAAVAGGYLYSLALKANGTVVAWGDNTYGQTSLPAGLTNVVAVAAGSVHVLALKGNGTVVAWGNNSYGQTSVPAGLSNVVAVAAGAYQSLALVSNGTVVAWGDNSYGQTNVPVGLSNVVALAVGCMAYDALVIQQQAISPFAALLTEGNNIFPGNLEIGGTMSAVYFSGGGGGLTELNASQLSTGTVPLALLPAAVLTNGENGVTLSGTLTGNVIGNLIGNATTATTAGLAANVVSGISITNAFITNSVFAGNGAGLNNLNAGSLTSGTVPLAQLSGLTSGQLTAATWQLATNLNGGSAALATNVVAGISITNAFITNSVFAGNGAGLANVSVNVGNIIGTLSAGQLPAGVLTNGQSGVTLSGTLTGNVIGNSTTATSAGLATNVVSGISITNAFITNSVFAGNGAGLNNLNAGSLTSGTVPLTQLSGLTSSQLTAATWQQATNLNGGSAALATNVVSGISITNAFITNSVFAGNGAGLANVSVNAGNIIGTLSAGQLPTSVLTNGETGVTLSGTLTGNVIGNASTATTAGLATNVVSGISITNAFITNSVFAGNGAGLANVSVNAGNIVGTLPASQLPAGVLTNGQSGVTLSGTLTGNVVGNATTATTAGLATNVVFGISITNAFITNSVFAGNGAGLANVSVNAGNIIGTLPASQLPAGVLTNGAVGVTLSGTLTGSVNGNAATASAAGMASTLISGASVTNAFITNSVFAGNGAGLANVSVNVGNIIGTLSAGQLPAGVLTNGASGVTLSGTLTGNVIGNTTTATTAGLATNVVSGISITNAFITNSVFAGNGAGLANVSVNAGNIIGTLPASQLPASVLTNGESGVTLTGTLTGNVVGNATTAASAGLATNVVSGISITNAFITNSVFAGNGAGLANVSVNAGNIIGTLPASQLPAGVLTNGSSGVTLSGTLTGNVIGNATTATTAGLATNVVSGISITNAFITNSVFAGDGSGLANVSVNAGNIVGTLPASQLPAGVLTNGASGVTLSGTLTGNVIGSATTATTAGLATNVVSGISITNAFITNSVFAGDGSGLANVSVNAGNIVGTLPASQLPAGVLTNGASGVTLSGTLTGNVIGSATTATTAGLATNVVSGISITNAFITNSVFAGNGAGLANVSVNAGNIIGTLPASQLPASVLTNGESGVTLTGTLTGNVVGNATTAASAGLATNVVSGISITNAFITNSVFAGNGAGLANVSVNAGNIIGTLPASQLPAGVLTNGASGVTLSGTLNGNVIGNAITATTAGLATNVVSGISITNAFITNSVFAGNGAGLANVSVNAGNIIGTLPASQLPASVLTNGASGVTLSGTLTGNVIGNATTATTAGLATNVVSGISITNAFITNSVFAGNGAGLANVSVNAGNIIGTLPASQLPAGVLTNGAVGVTLSGTLTGSVNGNAATASAAGMASTLISGASVTNAFITNSVFAGNGAGLTNVSVNAGNIVGTLPASQLPAGVLTNGQSGVTLSGTLTGNVIGNATTATTAGLATNVVSGISITNAFITNSVFAGNGSGLINVSVNAGNIAGTLLLAQLPAAVPTNGPNGLTLSNLTLTGSLSLDGGINFLQNANLNAAYGYVALTANTTGGANTAIGDKTLTANTTGANNTAVGYSALAFNLTGSNNVAVGFAALQNLTNGSGNIGVGVNTGSALMAGTNNIYIGNVAGTNENGIVRIGDGVSQSVTYLSGAVTAGSFTGNGAGLTNVNAAELTGTIPAASIGAGSITSTQLAAGSVTTTNLANGAVALGDLQTVPSYQVFAALTDPAPVYSVDGFDDFGNAVTAVGSGEILVGTADQNGGDGLAYLFGTNGTLLTTVTNPVPGSADAFGYAVAVMGPGLVLIGAPEYNGGSGLAYLFGTNGSLVTTYSGPDGLIQFGSAVAAIGSTEVLITAPGYNGYTGAAFLYGTNGTLLATLTNSTGAPDNNFGVSAAAVGNGLVLVGAEYAGGGLVPGVAFLFGTNGSLLTTITNPVPGYYWQFGASVAPVGPNMMLIGAPQQSSMGAVYLYGTNGTLLAGISDPNANGGDGFGSSITTVGAGELLIGAPGVNNASGAAYLYNTNGTLLAAITDPGANSQDGFGNSVAALGANGLIIGANGANSGSGIDYLIAPDGPPYVPGLISQGVLPGSITSASIASGAVGNGQLANNSIFISTGTGLSGGGSVALGGTLTLNNSGVLDVIGDSNIVATFSDAGIVTLTDNSTSADTVSTLVARDGNGNFSAGTITASFTGNGAGLSNVSVHAANIVGALSPAQLPAGVLTNGAPGLIVGNGQQNTAFGFQDLAADKTGIQNSAFGYGALTNNNSGGGNTALGYGALTSSTTGSNNVAVGFAALSALTNGSGNIGIGLNTGSALMAGTNNIYIGNIAGTNENGIIRIGTQGVQTATYLAGTVYANGVALTSDRNAKENFTGINAVDVLAKVAALPVSEWNYKTDSQEVKHIGPMAQDFQAAFRLDGADDRHISVVDEGGVALAAIQGLNRKVDDRDAKILAQSAEIQKLKQQNDALAARLNELESAVKNLMQKQ